MSQLYNEYLAPVGLRITQFSVLRAISMLGNGITASQIQEGLVMDQTTVSRALKPLIRDGYIEVTQGVNKREKLLKLTDSGNELYAQALVPWKKAQKAFKQKLGATQTDNLIELSRQVVALKS
jgi:DNA-binding MarR family transcriptional regulator